MADTRLEDLTDIATAGGLEATDIVYINRPGTDADYKGDADDITTYVLNNIPNGAIAYAKLSGVQASDATLTALAGVATAADKLIYATGSDTFSTTDFTAGGRALVNSAGTANTFPYFSASNTVTLGSVTAAALSILDDATTAAIATTLGLGTGSSPEFTGINIGHASNTTITQSAPGRIAVEGVNVALVTNAIRLIGFTATSPSTGKQKGYAVSPVAGTITGWGFEVDAGTATVKVWKKATGTAVPTVADNINTSGVAISSGTAVRSTTVTDFTSTAVSAGDFFAFNLSAVSGVAEMTFWIEITPT